MNRPGQIARQRAFAAACRLITVLILGGYLAMALWFPMGYLVGTYEDLFGEWLQFYLFGATLALSVRIFLRPSPHRLFFLLLALSCFYVAMEEVSWGQRLFGWSSPEIFRVRNLQGETNLHNLLTGPVRTGLKRALEFLLAGSLVGYGALYPVLLAAGSRAARWLDRLGVAAPPLSLWPAFTAAAVLELGIFRFNEAEVAEILVGFALAATAIHHAASVPGDRGRSRNTGARGPESGRAAPLLYATLITAVLLSAATTAALYATEEGKNRADARIERGIEKFGRRYARFGRWKTAVALYERVLERNPERIPVMRRLAEAHRASGDDANFAVWAEAALEADLERHRASPGRAAVNRSLVRTYRLLGEEGKAADHLAAALQHALDEVRDFPDSADAAHSLAETWALAGEREKALGEYRRASALLPRSKQYRRDYLSAQARMDSEGD